MLTDAEDRAWEEINHALIGLEQRHQRVRYEPENLSCSTLLDIPPTHIQAIRKTAEQTYGLYHKVWRLGGKVTSPEFIAVVYRKAIIPLLRSSSARFEHYVRYGKPSSCLSVFSPTGRSVMAVVLASRFAELLRALEEDWKERITIEAMRCKQERASTPAAGHGVSRGRRIEPGQLSTAAVLVSKAEAKRRRDAAIRDVWPRRKKGDIDYQFVCDKLDARGTPVVERWPDGSTWNSNLEGDRNCPNVKKYIHDVIRPRQPKARRPKAE